MSWRLSALLIPGRGCDQGPIFTFYFYLWRAERLECCSEIHTDLPKSRQIALKFHIYIYIKFVIFSFPIHFLISNRILTRYGFRTSILVGPTKQLLLLWANIQVSCTVSSLGQEDTRANWHPPFTRHPHFYIHPLFQSKDKVMDRN